VRWQELQVFAAKTIEMMGEMTWLSTVEYYRITNEYIMHATEASEGRHTARIILYSVDFHDVEQIHTDSDWEEWGRTMAGHARTLEGAGADFIVICTNTMHRLADVVEKAVSIPLLHIGDATAHAIRKDGLRNVGLLGTEITMSEDFLKKRLGKHGIQTVVPSEDSMKAVDGIIRKELVYNVIQDASRQKLIKVIDDLAGRGAEGVVLARTELPLLVSQDDVSVPIFDTTRIHAIAAADLALSQ